ncbi:TPA: EAL domain-containing protein [Vibrio parahaemolyticus]|nr:EAL domain-containing protein [Vibrio parahaemolyticus]UPR19043.1 EAL domain-containing protein [Vibrio parahaemolyticus]HAV1520176.1 EAL domain-containing protein [Vibrio parahaemolyticus]HAV1539142.1 EAL domain-containing protein [Vibrio parahaemolyticus]
MKPYVKVDGYPKAIESVERFKAENELVLAVWIRIDGYSEAFNQSIEDAESYAHEVYERIESCSNSYRQLLRLDERNFLLLIATRKSSADQVESKVLERLQSLPPFSFITPSLSHLQFLAENKAQDILSKLKYTLRNEWDLKVDQDVKEAQSKVTKERVELSDVECFFQPVYWVSNRLRGFEVLARWNHPLYGILEPSHFLAVLERQGELTELLFKQLSCIEKLIERRPNTSDVWFSLNVSLSSLKNKSVFRRFEELRERNINLELEIDGISEFLTESELSWIRDLGIRISINGIKDIYERFDLPVKSYDTVKLSPKLVKQLTHGDSDAIRMLKAWITRFVQSQKLLIANGVETRRAIELLASLRVDALQGFVIKAPMSFQEADEWLRDVPASLLFKAEDNIKPFRAPTKKK